MEYDEGDVMTKKLPSWKRIAEGYEAECSYLLRRCMKAEGKDADDLAALQEIVGAAQDAARV